MAEVSYTPGSWVAVAGDAVWLFAEVDGSAPLVHRWWTLVRAGASIDELLGTIVHEGFRTVGTFAIVQKGRAVVRGRVGLELPGEPGHVPAADVATWLEVPVEAGARFTSDHAGGTVRLPLGDGVVLASALDIVFDPNIIETPEIPEIPETPMVTTPTVAEPPVAEESPAEQAGFEYLLRETHHAPVAPAPASPARTPVPVGTDTMAAPEFDESGVLLSIGSGAAPPPPASGAALTVKRPSRTSTDQPMIQAIRCPAGHLGPERAPVCRVCGVSVPQQEPQLVPRPVLGRLRLSTGDTILLDRGVILGREPQPPPGQERNWNRFMLPSPGNDISRNHLEVRIDDWQVLVTDLGSTNGTKVTVPGMASWPLQPGEPVPIEPGTVVSLADEISFTFEVTG